jgi:hypothetical protein
MSRSAAALPFISKARAHSDCAPQTAVCEGAPPREYVEKMLEDVSVRPFVHRNDEHRLVKCMASEEFRSFCAVIYFGLLLNLPHAQPIFLVVTVLIFKWKCLIPGKLLL